MKLSDDQKKKLADKLTELSRARPNICSVCGAAQWTVADLIFELREFNPQGFVMGGPVMPVVAVMCVKCGHVQLLSAIHLGLVEVNKVMELGTEQAKG